MGAEKTMAAFIVYAPAFDDSGVLMRPVGHSGGWGVTDEQLDHMFRWCEARGLGRHVWPDCTRARLTAWDVKGRNNSLEAGLSIIGEEQVNTFALDSGEPLLARIHTQLRAGNLIVITH